MALGLCQHAFSLFVQFSHSRFAVGAVIFVVPLYLSISVAIGEIIDVFLSQESTYRSIDRKSPLNCSSGRVLISVYYRKIKKEKAGKRREGKR